MLKQFIAFVFYDELAHSGGGGWRDVIKSPDGTALSFSTAEEAEGSAQKYKTSKERKGCDEFTYQVVNLHTGTVVIERLSESHRNRKEVLAP